ncbi:MAG: aspartate 1-decarboxylase [Xanthobacteraceae bacterium]|nr:aspartate 1-decarboxylase [Xanthobacteraceae bacterium]QYK44345.1 MAG: aspartate 1-decarboxylase [Xanthobacteraceae bacterium]
MLLTLIKGKIHRAVVTGADLHYEGSIGIDRALMDAAGFLRNERVEIYNISSGARFATYVIEEPSQSGAITLNGAAARLVQKGDHVIICAYAQMDEQEAKSFKPRVILVDEFNREKGEKPDSCLMKT